MLVINLLHIDLQVHVSIVIEKSVNFTFFLWSKDSMFASASLDGAIILWSSLSLSYTRQFNFVKDYEGPFHTYPASTQHIFTVDQVEHW